MGGLSGRAVGIIGEEGQRLVVMMKQEGHTILLVEQNFRFATRIADRHYVMERGRIIDQIPRAEIAARESQIQQYLGI